MRNWKFLWIFFSITLSISLLFSCSKKEEEKTKEEKSAQIKQQKIIKIGAILPLTGPGAIFAQYIKEGIDLAVEEINNETKGVKLEILYEDSKTSPKEGINAYRKLLNTSNVKIFVVALSSVARAVAPLADSTKTVQFYIAVAIPNITKVSKYIFRVYPNAYSMSGKMAEFATKHLKYKKFAVVYINDDFGKVSKEVFEKIVKKGGGEVVFSEPYNLMQTDFRNIIYKLREKHPQAVYVTGYGLAYGSFIKQLKEIDDKIQVLADMTMGLPETIKQVGKFCRNIYYVDGKMESSFIKRFYQKYNKKPTSYAGYAYDLTNIIYKGIKESKFSLRNIDLFSSNILKVKNYNGAMGRISFNSYGDVNLEFSIFYIKNPDNITTTLY